MSGQVTIAAGRLNVTVEPLHDADVHVAVLADGSVLVGSSTKAEQVDPPAQPATPELATPKPPSRPAAKAKAGRQPRHTDDQVVEEIRAAEPVTATQLAAILGVTSKGSLNTRLRRLAADGHIEKVGRTWRTPRTATKAPTLEAVPTPAGSGVEVGPMERRSFDPDAARLRAAGGLA